MHEYWLDTDVSQLPKVKTLSGVVFSQDSGSNKIGVRVTDDGEPLTLTGTVKAWVIRANGSTIEVNGQKDGNEAWVILPAAAYSYPGKIGVFIKLLSGEDVITLGGIEARVYRTNII